MWRTYLFVHCPSLFQICMLCILAKTLTWHVSITSLSCHFYILNHTHSNVWLFRHFLAYFTDLQRHPWSILCHVLLLSLIVLWWGMMIFVKVPEKIGWEIMSTPKHLEKRWLTPLHPPQIMTKYEFIISYWNYMVLYLSISSFIIQKQCILKV